MGCDCIYRFWLLTSELEAAQARELSMTGFYREVELKVIGSSE